MSRHTKMFSAALLALAAYAAPGNAQVLVNEFYTGTPDWLELANFGSAPVDVSGWTVATWYATSATATTTTAEPVFVLPAGTIIPAGGFLVLQENGTAGTPGTLPSSLYQGFNYFWTNARTIEAAILDATGAGVDYVYFNYYGNPPHPQLPANQTWIGSFSTGTGDEHYRVQNADTDNATDWLKAAGSGTVAALNPGQTGCAGFFAAYGAGCVGANGVPTLSGTGCPIPGNNITIDLNNGAGGALVLILIGIGQLSAPINPGCMLQNLPNVPPYIFTALPPSGSVSVPATIPVSSPSNVDAYLQVLIADMVNPFGVASTNPLHVHIG